jgi:hypothetical protein
VSTTPPLPATRLALDHLVVVAHTLTDGVAWCERTLGVTPGPGGEHPLMGTHNRLLAIHSDAFPAAYLEIIAINSGAIRPSSTSVRRWFDMDNPELQHAIQGNGPQLVHWVARVPDLARSLPGWHALGLEPGTATTLSRHTASGPLTWQLSVRPDGQRPLGGCLPTLIQWGNRHPCDHLPPSGVTLQHLHLAHPAQHLLAQALVDRPTAISLGRAPHPILQATLNTPLGSVTLSMPHVPPAAGPNFLAR